MQRRLMAALVVAVSIVAAGTWVWGATRIPATDTFRDTLVTDPSTGAILAGSDRIRSDYNPVTKAGLHVYHDGENCVVTHVQTNFFFLRSYYPPACVTTPTRKITLDFTLAKSRPAGVDCSSGEFWVDVVNICGSNEFYDVRVIANRMFAKNAPTYGTPVTLPFNPVPFSSPQFELDFEQNLPVCVSVTECDPTTRTMEAFSTNTAELYEYVGGIKSSLGRYYMPFKLTVKKDY